jgi:hypothetical protein
LLPHDCTVETVPYKTSKHMLLFGQNERQKSTG